MSNWKFVGYGQIMDKKTQTIWRGDLFSDINKAKW